MMKQTKAVRIRKLLLTGASASTVAKATKCNVSYVYMIKKAMDEVTNVLEANKGKPRISLTVKEKKIAKKLGVPLDVYAKEKLKLDRCKNAAKDTGVPPRKEADALDHWENAVATPKSILDEAKDIIYGDREKTYGAPDKNLVAIAGYWANHLNTRFGVYHDITGADVCIMMTLLKAARLGNDVTHRDSLVDAVGYLALLERIQK
jgi:hypothetical protein